MWVYLNFKIYLISAPNVPYLNIKISSVKFITEIWKSELYLEWTLGRGGQCWNDASVFFSCSIYKGKYTCWQLCNITVNPINREQVGLQLCIVLYRFTCICCAAVVCTLPYRILWGGQCAWRAFVCTHRTTILHHRYLM